MSPVVKLQNEFNSLKHLVEQQLETHPEIKTDLVLSLLSMSDYMMNLIMEMDYDLAEMEKKVEELWQSSQQ